MLTAITASLAFASKIVLAADEEATEATMGTGFADSFWVVLLLAVAVFFLGYDLVRRLRRAKNRADIQAELAEEVAAMREAEAGATSDTADPHGHTTQAEPSNTDRQS